MFSFSPYDRDMLATVRGSRFSTQTETTITEWQSDDLTITETITPVTEIPAKTIPKQEEETLELLALVLGKKSFLVIMLKSLS